MIKVDVVIIENKLPDIVAKVQREVDIREYIGAKARDYIRSRVRVKTGALRGSIELVSQPDGSFSVRSNRPHAAANEFGTTRMTPTPAFAEAAVGAQAELAQLLSTEWSSI